MRQVISLPQEDVRSIDAPAEGVFGLRTVMVNVYGVRSDSGWVLIDAGLPMSTSAIRAWADARFGEAPKAILLTHGHFDHVGALQELATEWNVPVYAHPLEFPYLDGRSKYPPPDPFVGRGLMSLLSPLYPNSPLQLGHRLRALPEDGSVPHMPEWRWVHTPGHTHGHVSFFRDRDRVLIAGDAIITTQQEAVLAVATQRPELHGPPAYFTSDWDAAGNSVLELANLEPRVIAAGHGLPLSGPDTSAYLDLLASRFDTMERPRKGRYADEGALADSRGVLWIPPAGSTPMKPILAGVAVAGIVYMLLRRGRSNTTTGSYN